MNIVNDIVSVYKKAFTEAKLKISKNPMVLFLPLIFSLIISATGQYSGLLLSGTGIFGGFIRPIIDALILSILYDMLSNVIYYDRLSFKGLKRAATSYFGAIYSVYFILILVSWILRYMGNIFLLSPIVWIIIFVVFNPISEAVYIKDESYISAFVYSFDFMKKNFIHWMIPVVIFGFILAIMGYTPGYYLGTFSQTSIINIPVGIMPGYRALGRGISLQYFIAEIIAGFYIIFRGCLFKILSTSTMRKRQYMGGLN